MPAIQSKLKEWHWKLCFKLSFKLKNYYQSKSLEGLLESRITGLKNLYETTYKLRLLLKHKHIKCKGVYYKRL